MTHSYPFGQDAYPPELLQDYLAVARQRPRDAVHATALRTGSLAARFLLAYAATGGAIALAQLLEVARSRQTARLPATGLNRRALADMARVIGLQELLPEDPADALALFDLTHTLGGPKPMLPEHQAIHAQLAFRAGDRARAAELLASYRSIPEHTAQDLRIDLANPFVSGGPEGAERDWWRAFRQLLPKPYPDLAPAEDVSPFDRLVTTKCSRVDGGERISVIVTVYRPGAELLTAVRSLVTQSWVNLEILLVDDGSPPEHDVVLKQCQELDPRVRLVRLDVNRGTYVARNAGIEAAAGRYVTFHDSDDWAHPRRLEHQLRPLVEDGSVCTTLTDGLRVTDQLVITRPGRQRQFLYPSSVMVRKDTVVGRIGYFDPVRKGADGEYLARIEAAFGAEAVHHDRGALYTVRRLSTGSLSEAEFRAGWMHPARAAYKSAYHLWHQRIREGNADPYLPVDPPRRRFAAPVYLRQSPREPAPPQRYDVVVAGDWRPLGDLPDPMLEQVLALRRRGLRVGVAHLEAFRATDTRQHLRRGVQELINGGSIAQVVLSDEVDTSLLLLHHPPVLQFPPSLPARLRAARMVIVADVAPSGQDGRDRRYVPETCAQVARKMFGVDPLWSPHGLWVRERLAHELPATALAPFDLPGVVDPQEWQTERRRFCLDRPVIGRHGADDASAWPDDLDTLLAAYPDGKDVEVRILGGGDAARTVLGTEVLPSNWLAYQQHELKARVFFNQIDFYVYFPHPDAVEFSSQAVLEALASGCVAILPERLAGSFGDAAFYCRPAEVPDVVRTLRADPAAYQAQSRRAREWVRASASHEVYADLVTDLIAGPGPRTGGRPNSMEVAACGLS